MAIMNLLKANYVNKLGATVGANWKGKPVLRVYTKPTYTDYPAQHEVRTAFGKMNKFVALFSDELKTLTALDVRARSVRNAIVHLNHEMMGPAGFTPATLLISKGGLQAPSNLAFSTQAAGNTLTGSFTSIVGTLISQKAVVVAVAVDAQASKAFTGTGLNSSGSVTIKGTFTSGEVYDVYGYLLDWRGSSKVGSLSIHTSVTIS
jgi:hypothetical protein